jgi:hypothetical protein
VSEEDANGRRSEAAAQADYHAKALQRRREQEAAEAQLLIDRFVARATAANLPTEELMARPWSGSGRYRTGLVGWYLRQNQSIAVDTNGAFYRLVVAPQRFGRWRTVTVEPTPPPLDPGQGARDGEAGSLESLLELRLPS